VAREKDKDRDVRQRVCERWKEPNYIADVSARGRSDVSSLNSEITC